MKQFAVIRYDQYQVQAWNYVRAVAREGITGVAYSGPQEVTHAADMTENQTVYYVDTQADALRLAGVLTERYPGKMYLCVQTTDVFTRKPGELSRAQWTPDGLLPV